MALIHSFEKSGNTLFQYRGQIPTLLFLLAIPIIYFTDYTVIPQKICDLLTIIAVMLSILGFYIRAYTIGTTPKGTSGRNRKEQVAERLNVSGIYSILRHPLYLGNYPIWAGIVVFTFNIWFFLLFSLLYWLYYERIMFAEERFLEKKFGDIYVEWSLKVPAFIPAFKHFVKNDVPFSFKSILRREYSGAFASAFGFAFVDLIRNYFINHSFEWQRISVYTVAFFALISLILRTLKHKNLLNEEGRS